MPESPLVFARLCSLGDVLVGQPRMSSDSLYELSILLLAKKRAEL